MGLAGPKNKRKLGNDPNNTKWSRNTDSFGHRMLRSQGWEPGQFLGPQDSAHAAFHTAASASHIRVALKDDNLGLGAKVNRGDECTGLNAFKEMLARLNGKSEAAIEKDKLAREEHMRSVYIERKFGSVRFVSGGLLVGDKIDESIKTAKEADSKASEESAAAGSGDSSEDEKEVAQEQPKKEKKSKKRKAREAEDETDSKEERRREKKKRRRQEAEASGASNETSDAENDDHSTEARQRRKKDKKDKKDKKKRKQEEAAAAEKRPDDESSERKKKKEKKEKKRAKAEKASSDEEASGESTETPATGTSTPVDNGTSTPVSQVSARYLSRRRFIAQKRMALNDPQALNQIFMIKSA